MTVDAASRSRLAPDERREQILAAATTVFLDRPYADVSTADLAQRAGVARALINHYFGGKRGLYLAVVRRLVTMPRDGPGRLDDQSLEDRAAATIEWILQAATSYGRAWVGLGGTASVGQDRDLQDIIDTADDRAATIVLDVLGLVPSPTATAVLRSYAALVKATCREWLVRESLTRDEAHTMLTRVLLALVEDESVFERARP